MHPSTAPFVPGPQMRIEGRISGPLAGLTFVSRASRPEVARLTHLLAEGTILCLPTTPFPAPAKGQAISALDIVRDRITCLAAHGGLVGVPQVSIPGATVNGLPMGLSVVGAHGQDAMLVAVAKAVEDRA